MNAAQRKRVLDAIPDNWCDYQLTGPNAAIGKPPFDCRDIERLLVAIRVRVEAALPKPTKRRARR